MLHRPFEPMRSTRIAVALLLTAAPAPVAAQATVIQGRVEDALSRIPLPDVTLFSADSSRAAVTDSMGAFVLRLPAEAPLTVLVERVGYQTSWFHLPESAAERRAVLRLEPEPIELQGIEIVGESAVTETLEALERRRNGYFGAVSAFDRLRLEELAGFGTVSDFVRREAHYAYPCHQSASGLCSLERRGRRSIPLPPTQRHVRVCLDGRESWLAELDALDIESVALVEIYRRGRGGIRVYTPGFITAMARRGRTISSASPPEYGC